MNGKFYTGLNERRCESVDWIKLELRGPNGLAITVLFEAILVRSPN